MNTSEGRKNGGKLNRAAAMNKIHALVRTDERGDARRRGRWSMMMARARLHGDGDGACGSDGSEAK